MDDKVAEELCGFFDELALFTAETYRKAATLEAMAEREIFTMEEFRQREGKTDADVRLAELTDTVARLREALHLPERVRPTLPEKPDVPDVSFLDEE
jgi:hypothetical protein